ncbi:retrotransposon hot spot (RHS) protein, putative, partial [Trypanosoma cruzi marinkellei]
RQTTEAPVILEGLYESVYNARWHHVVELPDDEKTKTGMEVKEGKPKHSWTYKKVGLTLEKDDGAEQFGAAPPRLMVLTSDKGWPYTLNAQQGPMKDFFINCEVERVWQIVSSDLTKWFDNFDLSLNPSPTRRLLIGTPGIGKSMAAGSYLLYHIKKLQVIVHCFGETAYVFDKTAQTVTQYEDNITSKIVVRSFWQRGMNGYIIYDVARKGTPPDTNFAPASGWGMIVVSSPKVSNYDEWEKQLTAKRIIMNCPDEMDVKAMCAWMKQGVKTDEQAEYWEMVKTHMDEVGPIPRYIFDDEEYIDRMAAVNDALVAIKPIDGKYLTEGGTKLWYSENPSQKLVKIVRAKTEKGAEVFLNAPICADIGLKTVERLRKVMSTKDFLLLILGSLTVLVSRTLERFGLHAFLFREFISALVKELKELKPREGRGSQESALKENQQGHPTRTIGLKGLQGGVERKPLEYRVLYIPAVDNFPLVDGVFFVDSPRKTLVGLQMTTASAHHTITSTVKQFKERLAAYFEGWGELSREMSWEMIYVQHKDNKPMKKWQNCDVVNSNNKTETEKEIVAFWNGKLHQYQFSLTPGFAWKMREMTIQ